MKKFYCLLTLVIIGSFSSCKKFLEKEPTNFVSPEYYYETADQLQMALNGVYDRLTVNEVYGYNLTYWLTTSNDETYQISNSRPENTYAYNSSLSYIEGLWKALYTGITRSNLLLANINKPTMDETKRDIIKGEALFMRAYYYFLLVSNYGDVPLILEPTSSVDNVNIARTPTKAVYEQITKDMITAEGLLKTQTATSLGYGGKVSKTAVQGILARVYLTMAGFPLKDISKYNDALDWAQKVVASGEHALNPDYQQIFINLAQNKYDVKECIWEAEMYGDATNTTQEGSQALGNFVGISQSISTTHGFSSIKVRPTKLFYDSFEINPASSLTPNKASFDLRRDWNCANYNFSGDPPTKTTITNTWAMSPGKWRRELTTESPKDKNYTPINVPLLRYADVLLMLAEAENELHGPTPLAINAVNEVRRRGYGKSLIGNVVKSITVTSGGSDYSTANLPTITISAPGSTGTRAIAATPTISGGKITSILVSNPGSMYTSAPQITITGGAGSGAVAVASITATSDADLSSAKTANKSELLKAIKEERARELFTEGLRKSDLIRWGNFVDDLKALVDYGNATKAPSAFFAAYNNVSERYLLLPIPNRELGLNKLLTQNPGF